MDSEDEEYIPAKTLLHHEATRKNRGTRLQVYIYDAQVDVK